MREPPERVSGCSEPSIATEEPGTICAPSCPDDIKIGGAHQIEVDVVTPKWFVCSWVSNHTDTKDKAIFFFRSARPSTDLRHFLGT